MVQVWSAVDAPPSTLIADRRKFRAALGGTATNAPSTSGCGGSVPSEYEVEVPKPRRQGGRGAAAQPVTSSMAPAGRRGGDCGVLHARVPVHDAEALGAQVLTLKKELAACRAENKLLRVGKERMETELRKAEYESEQALRSGGLVDGVGAGATRAAEARLLKSLKAKTRELQEEVQLKEAQISELSGASKGMRLKELEVQTKVYLDEARRLKELLDLQASERAEAEASLREAHAGAVMLKEQQLDSLRDELARLRKENGALDEELGRWMDENEMLRDKVGELEGRAGASRPAAQLLQATSAAAAPPSEIAQLRSKVKELQLRLKSAQKDRERVEADKLAIFGEMNEAVQKLETDLKQEKVCVRQLRVHLTPLSASSRTLSRAPRSPGPRRAPRSSSACTTAPAAISRSRRLRSCGYSRPRLSGATSPLREESTLATGSDCSTNGGAGRRGALGLQCWCGKSARRATEERLCCRHSRAS